MPSEEDDNGSNFGAYGDETPRRAMSRLGGSSLPSAPDPSVDASRRPSSTADTFSQRGTWLSQRPPSRRSHLGAGHAPVSRTGTPGSVTSSGAGRPQSIVSRPHSAASKTHVPSLTSHAFFRPMSSQRLQAQRAVRHQRSGHTAASDDGFSEVGSNANRYSYGSHSVVQLGSPALQEQEEFPPPSRDTEMTEHDGQYQPPTGGSVVGNRTVRSLTDSVTPLHDRSANLGSAVDATDHARAVNAPPPPPDQRVPPTNLRSKLRGSAGGLRANTDGSNNKNSHGDDRQGHEVLPSTASSPVSNPIKSELPRKQKKPGSNFEYFTGNRSFCWRGRLHNTRDRPINVATALIVIVPSVLFFAYSYVDSGRRIESNDALADLSCPHRAPWLWRNISPAIPLLFGYLFLISVSSFVHASFSDPGVCSCILWLFDTHTDSPLLTLTLPQILPRNLHPFAPTPAHQDPLALGPPTTTWTIIKSARDTNGAMEVPTKYCKSCNLWRPPRAHHCRVCDSCIETQDHHCVWLNNCVGRRNYRYFFTFVSSTTLLGLFLCGASLGHVLLYRSRERTTFGGAADRLRVPMALVVYAVLATPYTCALLAYHSLLIAKGETTREYLNSHKFPKRERHRPFRQPSLLQNVAVVLGRPRPPTYLRFKDRYEDGDQRFGPRRTTTITASRPPPSDEERRAGGMEMAHVKRGLSFTKLQNPWTRRGRER